MDARSLCAIFADFLSGRKNKIDSADFMNFSTYDWNNLAKYSDQLGISALLYIALKHQPNLWQQIPLSSQETLKQAYLQNAASNTRIYHESAKVLKALNDNQIPVIALKGLYLAEKIYRDIALRPMQDIDLLVKKKDLLEAGNLLLSLGYVQRSPSWDVLVNNAHHLPAFFNKTGAVVIELHWDLIDLVRPFEIDLEGIWERANTISINGVEVKALSVEDSLLYLSLHASFHHGYQIGLRSFCDIARVISQSDIDWERLRQRAIEWRAVRSLYLILYFTQKLLKVEIPDDFMLSLKPADFDPVFFSQLGEQFLLETSGGNNDVYWFCIFYDTFKAKKSFKTFFALLKRLFPHPTTIARRYPIRISSVKLYLCYLMNLRRLILEYSRVPFQFLFRDREFLDSVEQENKRQALLRWIAMG